MVALLESRAGRITGFIIACVVIWGAYFAWSRPIPLLFLAHVDHLDPTGNAVSLTFDDGPHPLTTPLLLASLKRANVKATFYCIGEGLRLYPELAHRLATEGQQIANHSDAHHNMSRVDPVHYPTQIDTCFDTIRAVGKDAGVPQLSNSFRPPGGGLDHALLGYMYRHNYSLGWWSNNIGDWTCPPVWQIVHRVEANLRPGDIILLHDGGTGTPQAIPAIVREARRRGLRFVMMPQATSLESNH